MIRLLRKIRRGLLVKNNFGKYLLYAIGEIILVVIGILIALQLNNLNEERKERHLKGIYITRLIADIRQDSLVIRNNRKLIEESQKIIENTVQVLNHTMYTKEDLQVMEGYFYRGWATFSPSFIDNTYKDLSQTGNMNIFSNTEIRKDIMQYYAYMEEVRNANRANEEWVLPFDIKVAETTSALEFSLVTKELFAGRDKQLAVTNLLANKDLLEKSAAAHYWMNNSVLQNLDFMENEAQEMKMSLQRVLKAD